ncbi:MAG: thioredoxin family protein [Bacteroidetes bacterium]|nr:thioredoxin family protein [Bacteroidota bacterium]
MISLFKKSFAALFIILWAGNYSGAQVNLAAQIKHPAKWSYSILKISDTESELVMKASIEPDWHLYSPFQTYKDEPGPQAAIFTFKPDKKNYNLVGKLNESKVIKERDEIFEVDVRYFTDEAIFRQKIKRLSGDPFKITGTISYQVCKEVCIPEEEYFTFKFDRAELPSGIDTSKTNPIAVDSAVADTVRKTSVEAGITTVPAPPVNDCSPFASFWYGILAGLGALLAPCIFSMLPLTTAFFVKQSKKRSHGIQKAMLYGFFIILIFDVLGIVFGNFVYGISSHEYFNLFLFVLFMIFAFSFFGAFEITLPNALVNKADQASDRGGVVGIFFMALTLALVSFSCTVPYVAGLITLVNSGSVICPLMGFTGFGLSLALPFVIFAMFPGWLHSLPKSGGWMNTVKVSLGFLEVALAMKFFSNADLVAGWHLISREMFIAIWVVCFGLMGIYLLGLIKFQHDDVGRVISVPRAVIAIVVLSFTLYLFPGLFGAPVNLIAGFPPPQTAEWSENLDIYNGASSSSDIKKVNDIHSARCPKGLVNCFHDYDKAISYAKEAGKPVMIDFTGWTCVNCRKMEQNVWSDPQVLKRIRDEYVLVSLYVDDREKLAPDAIYTNKEGREINTVGKKWLDFQLSHYKVNAQPYYVLVDHSGKELVPPVGYTPNVDEYIKYLDAGKAAFLSRK